MLKLQDGIFKFITKDAVSILFIEKLLKAGNILFFPSFYVTFTFLHLALAKENLQSVSPAIAEDLILSSAKEYFNSAASIEDEQMKMAKEMYLFYFFLFTSQTRNSTHYDTCNYRGTQLIKRSNDAK